MVQIAAVLYGLMIAGVIVFQLCLVAGAPWGRWTQGGRHEGVLPVSGRVAAGVSAVLLACMAAAITSAAGLPPNWPMWASYVALALQAATVLLNWITPSRAERFFWGPGTSVMLALAAYVVLAGSTLA